MNKLRKILKAILIGIVVFCSLTVLVALLISYTSVSEKYSYIALIAVVTIVCIVISFFVGCLFDSKGILVGLITSIVTVETLILTIQLVLLGEINSLVPDIFYVISVLFGTVAGIAGVNNNK